MASGAMASLSGCTRRLTDREPSPTGTSEAPPSEDSPTGTTTEPTEEGPEARFETVVDAVDDLGCDPSGGSPCGTAIEGGAGDGVAIRFPPGTYTFDRSVKLHDYGRVGFIGEGDVTFVPPEGFNDKLIWYIGEWALFTGIDVDLTAPDTTAGLRFITFSGFELGDVEFLGRGTHPDGSIVNALSLAVSDTSGEGIVRDLVALQGSAIGHYKGGNGRVGIWIGERHNGHITIENTRLEEFGNNGIYASRCLGTVEVVGGVFRNNNVCGVRLGGAGNVIRGTTIEVDTDRYTGPSSLMESSYNTRAIVIEQGPLAKAGRVLIEDCDVRMVNADRSQGAIVVWPSGNGPRIERCRITTDVDWVAGVRGIPPESTVDPADRAVEIVDTEITGGAANGSAVELRDRPDSLLDRTTIDQSGANRDGVQLIASNPVRLAGSSITTTRYPIFAIDPVTESDECLVYLWGDTTLESSGPISRSLRSSEVQVGEVPRRSGYGVPDGALASCAGETILAELDSPPKGVGITGVADGDVSWTHHSMVETASRR